MVRLKRNAVGDPSHDRIEAFSAPPNLSRTTMNARNKARLKVDELHHELPEDHPGIHPVWLDRIEHGRSCQFHQ